MKSWITCILLGLALCKVEAQSLEESQQSFIKTKAPTELTWENFDSVANHARQDKEERRYLNVHWHNSVLDAQREAFDEDKPILMILFFGDHRSNC